MGFMIWVYGMKTTIDISNPLFNEARRYAQKNNKTFKELVESALRQFLNISRSPKKFKLKKCAFKGKGLQEGIREGDWEQIRSLIYEGRGG